MNASKPTSAELMESAQPLVISIATKVRRNIPVKVDLDDLIAYGEVGLAEAARDFDPHRGASFTTFAYYRVRGAIYDGISKMSWTSRSRYRRWRFQQMSNEYLGEQANSPHAGGDLESEAKWLRDTTNNLAVIFFASRDEGQAGIRDSTIEDTADSAINIVAQREIIGKLRELVESLPFQERNLIRSVYFEGATLQDAGNLLGISKSWASRLHAKALDQLSRELRRMDAHDG